MHDLLFDRDHRVLLVRLQPRFDGEAVEGLQEAGRLFVAREGRVDSVIDFSPVEEVTVAVDTLASRALQRPVMGDYLRVYVMPRDDIQGLGQMFASNQRITGSRAPVVVRSMDDAFATLGLFDPKFEAVVL